MAAKAASITRRERKPRPRWVRTVKRIFAVGFLFFLIGATWFGVLFVGEMRHASELLVTLPDKLKHYSVEPSKIVSRDHQVLWTIQSEFREPVTYDQIPKRMRDAMVAAEDKRFWEHSGVDYWAMGRIMLVGAREGHFSQGASTLTMQLAKKFYSEGERTFNRKLQDVALAITMERDMTKEQILTLYLNTMYFGSKAYGIQAAADVYFGKPLDKLSIAQCAMLARCVRRPSDENPIKNLKKSIENRNIVLAIMREQHMITEDEYQQAIAEKVKLSPPKERITSHLNHAPYFVDHVLQSIEQDLPDVDLKQGGVTIETTLDTRMQDYAEKQVAAFVRKHREGKVNQAAFVLMDKDGKILAEVGGLDYGKSQFNIVTQGQLQPGSSFKAFLYATALSEGRLSMSDTLGNMPFTYDGPGAWSGDPWVVHNSSPRENSESAGVERAFALSLNIPAAHVMERVGPNEVVAFATGIFGFRSKLVAVPSLALGTSGVTPLEMAQGYSVFMLHGDRAQPYCVTRVTGPSGEVLLTHEPRITKGVLDPRIADDLERLLRDVCEWGTGSEVGDLVPNAHGKTGTTSDHKDIWFCGYTDGLVGVAWAGNNTVRKGRVYQLAMGSSMWGATAASDLWARVMSKAHERFASPIPDFVRPDGGSIQEAKPDQPEDKVTIIPPPDESTGSSIAPLPETTGGTAGGTGGGTSTAPPGGDGGPGAIPATTPPDQPPVRPDPRHGRREPPPDQGDTVTVEICAETGMRATIYCPETVMRTYKKGHEPKKRCTLHGG